jgi:hypothetical protein
MKPISENIGDTSGEYKLEVTWMIDYIDLEKRH